MRDKINWTRQMAGGKVLNVEVTALDNGQYRCVSKIGNRVYDNTVMDSLEKIEQRLDARWGTVEQQEQVRHSMARTMANAERMWA